MPPKKAAKQPVRQLTRTPSTPPARRRPTGAATMDLTATDATGVPMDETSAAPVATHALPTAPPPVATPPRPMPGRPAATPMPRRGSVPPAGSGLRSLRGRVAQQIQTMDLREEMAWIRSDIARLSILAALGFVILIVLAIVLPMMGL